MVEAPQSGNQVEPVELEDSKDEVEHVNNRRPKLGRSFVWDHLTIGCAIYRPNQPIVLAEPIFGNHKETVG
ncbi:hypothetical protein DVH24_040898 [Malus domestica]|uniref:Uncharacterized protein n=1 Tax=Malus domestica TaxID=3750 RepID=A0A498IDX1_MALDO|nr:hypothetical protein DVH24_040898 [Malus domestica]